MNKYRLKKDLPFAKAGDEVRFNNKTFNFEAYSEEFNGQWFPFAPSMQTDLISRGWIEKVEPREIYIHHHKLDAPKVARDKDDICFNCKCEPTLYREVIQ